MTSDTNLDQQVVFEPESERFPSVSTGASFHSLPLEIQKQVLRYTDLVIGYQPVPTPQGFTPVTTRRNHGNVPWSLFQVSPEVSRIARDVLFSENRIILNGTYAECCAWIKRQQPELLRQIQRLDLFHNFRGGKHGWYSVSPEWDELAGLVADRFHLPHLTLSIDGAHDYDMIEVDNNDGECYGGYPFAWLKPLYHKAIEPFSRRAEQFAALHAFFVFWPKYGQYETDCERAVMAKKYKKYRSTPFGKIPLDGRDHRMPHGFVWEERDRWGYPTAEYEDCHAEGYWEFHQRDEWD